MEIFETCHAINDYLSAANENDARNELIQLLDYLEENKVNYPPIVNHLIRRTGLYPYLQTDTADWDDRYVYEAFKADVGEDEELTLHREQARLLRMLLDAKDVAVSAPTSFGKSFVVDAFISIKKPKIVVIIVPTIALTDETRRRVQKKFGNKYKIITTTEVELDEYNILIFPQERATQYINKLKNIDILIIDEFYKASAAFDKERSTSLLKAILKLGNKSEQRYFLAPNISKLNDSPFTEGMEFVSLDFNTVYLRKFNWYEKFNGELDDQMKRNILLKVLDKSAGKTLIYAGTYKNITEISEFLSENLNREPSPLLLKFSYWLKANYGADFSLAKLVFGGTGVHNGQLHRSLSQIQVKLFEEKEGLKNIISTSSIIEGVNTSAKNIVLWKSKNGRSNINDFTYKNIIGRGGRMFRHFVGDIHILDKTPVTEESQLNLFFTEDLLADVDEEEYKQELTLEQVAAILDYKEQMADHLGAANFAKLQDENAFQSSDYKLLKRIAADMRANPAEWSALAHLNYDDPKYWDKILYKVIEMQPSVWGIQHSKFVAFVKIISQNWNRSIPQDLLRLKKHGLGISELFKLERAVSFNLASLLGDVNTIQMGAIGNPNLDISKFIARAAHAFLPPVVYQLEEYGLPRMISRKIQNAGLVNFERDDLDIYKAIDALKALNDVGLIEAMDFIDDFDKYILDYFFDGV